jgi:probable F420-dependent oxidoreductase
MLGTGICLVVERDPILLAKEVASLDRISNGRVILGIGAGWNAEEMENHGTPYKKRWSVLRERVLAIREIWCRDAAEFHGEFVDFDPLWSWPKPVQKSGPKILLGSESKHCFERIIEYCDGWMPIASTGAEHELADGLEMLRARWESAGRSPGSLEQAVIGMPPEEETARRLMDAGFTHLIFSIPPGDAEQMLHTLDICACLASKITDSNDSRENA